MYARPRLSDYINNLLYDDCAAAIRQSRMCRMDTDIAEMYLLERTPQIDIAEILGITRSTISRRLPAILERVEATARKMGLE